ncbi:MAG TPA: PVC-type heme-binding CxxCH protein [Tepidisphaeraceae bacterium]|jgi:putative membrane-bound dehydrogenase-like protein|nr:PVC-type heme-binding CxxCH protein [Tepidisphaeraceae bacterium]
MIRIIPNQSLPFIVRWRRRVGALVASLAILSLFLSGAAAEQVRLNGKTFTLPDAFTIELAAIPPVVDRPIEADFDELGNLYVSDSSGSNDDPHVQLTTKPHRILRLSSSQGDGVFDRHTIFADKMTFPEGVLWLDDSLYVAGVPSIWKLSDSHGIAGPGVADKRLEWFAGKTITHCANDLHGPYAGPDGWIYWCKGAFAEQTYEHAGLPSRAEGGQRKTLVTRASHIFRARRDGTGIEPVMTGGMDNPIEVAFTPGGERIFTTTFLQNPAGGHRDGLIHAVYGGVYGKAHDVLDNQPRTSPDLLPVLSHLGPAACCGLVRYESDVFGPEYRNNLFVTCFNLHKVTRHELTAAGATFVSRDTDFLTCDSLDFHPTDVLEEADGSLLIIDTGGWYKLCCPTSQLGKPDLLGAIYRVRRKNAPHPGDPRGLKLEWNAMSVSALARLLDAPPAIRKRAIAALAAKGPAALHELSQIVEGRNSASADARLSAVWALTRIDDPLARAAVRTALADGDEIVRQAAAHSTSVWRDRDAEAALQQLLKTGTPQNQRVAAEALGRLGDAQGVPALLAAITKADPADRVLDHSLTYALMEIDDPASTAVGLSDASPRVRRSAMVALDQMVGAKLPPEPVVAGLSSRDTRLRESAAWIAGGHPEWAALIVDGLAKQWDSPNPGPDERMRLIQQAAAMARSPVGQDWLAARASDANATTAQRRSALQAMTQSALKDTPASWIKAVAGALGGKNVDLLADAVAAAGTFPKAKHPMPEIDSALVAIGARAELPPILRLRAMAAIADGMPGINPELFSFLRGQLALDKSVEQRVLAAEIIGKAALTPVQMESVVQCVASAGPLELDPLLAAFRQKKDPAIGRKLVAAVKQSKAAKSLRPEMLRRRLAGFGPEVQKDAEELYATLNPDAAKMKARLDELEKALPPGDIRRGQILFNGTRASCVACHAIGYVGGDVGPDLTRIGQTRAERDLLESIVFPSASFVQSFEPVQIDTVSGDHQYGIIRGNTTNEIVLVTGPNQKVNIPRSDIKELRPGTLSLMPAGFDQTLTPQELADLVAFLRACK